MKPGILIWGASRHARVVAEIIELAGVYDIAGFIDDVNPESREGAVAGRPVLGGREALAAARERGLAHLIFGFGRAAGKPALAAEAGALGFVFPTAIHPGAHVPTGTRIGAGAVIKAGAVLDPDVRIGAHAIIGANTVLTHGSELGDGVRIAAGAVLGSDAKVEPAALIGIGARVSGGLRIGAGALVGAGAVVLEDVPAGMVVAGSPARVMREARADDF